MQGMRLLAVCAALVSMSGCAGRTVTEAEPQQQTKEKSEWIPISVAPDGSSSWELQRRSFEFGNNNFGDPIGIVNGRIVSYSDSRVELVRWHVTLADCVRGMGKMASSDTSNAYLGEVDFSFGGGTHASRIAQAICEVADYKAQSLTQPQAPGSAIAPEGQGI